MYECYGINKQCVVMHDSTRIVFYRRLIETWDTCMHIKGTHSLMLWITQCGTHEGYTHMHVCHH